VGDLRRAIAGGEPIRPDDGYHDDSLHAGLLAGLVQVPGRGDEERRCLLLLGRGPGGRVDDALHACQRFPETVPGDHVDAAGTRDRDDVVSPGLEHVDDMTANPPSCPSDRNLPWVRLSHDSSFRYPLRAMS